MPRGYTFPREIRIAAVADYLLGKSLIEIELTHKVGYRTVLCWIRQVGCFKMRKGRIRG